MTKHTISDLYQMQSLPLSVKIRLSMARIRGWIDEYGEDGVYISFSGGKDSTVLLDLVRSEFPNIPAVFVDTGLEYPEIRDFVKSFKNVTWLKPAMNFKKVIETYGYPFFGKEIASKIYGARVYWRKLNNGEKVNYASYMADMFGIDRRSDKNSSEYIDLKNGKIPPSYFKHLMTTQEFKFDDILTPYNCTRYQFMLNAPFEVSSNCCNIMKKTPVHKYAKETGRKPFLGQQASESRLRTSVWLKHGCNAFDSKNPVSNPLSFWTEQDILEYIRTYNLSICSVYGEIIEIDNKEAKIKDDVIREILWDDSRPFLRTTGCSRTGCMFCGFGCHLDKYGEGRFMRLSNTHPKQYDYIMRSTEQGGLNYKYVIDWINEHGKFNIEY